MRSAPLLLIQRERGQPRAVRPPYYHIMTGVSWKRELWLWTGQRGHHHQHPSCPVQRGHCRSATRQPPTQQENIQAPTPIKVFQPKEFLHRPSAQDPRHGPCFHSSALGAALWWNLERFAQETGCSRTLQLITRSKQHKETGNSLFFFKVTILRGIKWLKSALWPSKPTVHPTLASTRVVWSLAFPHPWVSSPCNFLRLLTFNLFI